MSEVRTNILTAAVALAAAVCMSASAFATQPPDVVTSDSNENTAMGKYALNELSADATVNTAAGAFALGENSDGRGNSAFGADALGQNTIGNDNTAVGYQTLQLLGSSDDNTAIGAHALYMTTAAENTAVGSFALTNDTTGYSNTAFGYKALTLSTTGHQNAALGNWALSANTVGSNNFAAGANSLRANTSGGSNVGLGVASLQNNTTGQNNLAIGTNALFANITGSSNTAIGVSAGLNITGKNNIAIGNPGQSGESGTIRIGNATLQSKIFLAGIYNSSVGGANVMVDSNGQLGIAVSSERFKTAIEPMGAASHDIDHLRPVTFRLKTDPRGALHFGLIAEEVARIYPDLVVRDTRTGRIDSVRYDELAPLLLNEMQEQAKRLHSLEDQLAILNSERTEMREQLASVNARLARR